MAFTALEVKNLALSAIDSRAVITDPTEKSVEREICDLWYRDVLSVVQSAAHFPSSKVELALALVREQASPSGLASGLSAAHYRYTYRWPTNCLRPWFLTTYRRFAVGFDPAANIRVIYTDEEAAVLVYAKLQETVQYWESVETQAVIYGLASRIAGPLGGKTSIINRNLQLANDLLSQAQTNVSNYPTADVDFVPDRYAHTGYAMNHTRSRFVYPYGSLLSAATNG